jgi:hypothetical protein
MPGSFAVSTCRGPMLPSALTHPAAAIRKIGRTTATLDSLPACTGYAAGLPCSRSGNLFKLNMTESSHAKGTS